METNKHLTRQGSKSWLVGGLAVLTVALAAGGTTLLAPSALTTTVQAATTAINDTTPAVIGLFPDNTTVTTPGLTASAIFKTNGAQAAILASSNSQFAINKETAGPTGTVTMTYVNNTSSTQNVAEVFDINKGGGVTVNLTGPITPTTDQGTGTNFTYQLSNSGTYQSPVDAATHWNQITGVYVHGQLDPGKEISFDVPVSIDTSNTDPISFAFDGFDSSNYTFQTSNGVMTTSSTTVADQDEKILANNPTYSILKINSITPATSTTDRQINSTNITSQLQNLPAPAASALHFYNFGFNQPEATGALVNGYQYQLDLKGSGLQAALNQQGYSIEYNKIDGTQLNNYSMSTNGTGAITDDPTASAPNKLYVYVNQILNAHDSTISTGSTWDPKDNFDPVADPMNTQSSESPVTYDMVKANGSVTIKDAAGQTVDNIDTSKPGTYTVTYAYASAEHAYDVSKTITVTVQAPNSGNAGNNGSSSSSSSSSTTGSTTKPSTGNNTATSSVAKGTAVYATKTIYLYKNPTFKSSQRIVKYSKQTRPNRPMFVVTGTAKSKNGVLRYKVKDVNHKSATDGKTGYITANKNYVLPVYYATKHSTVKVIAKTGLNSYKTVKQTGKVKHYKKGATLKVSKIVKHNLTTRFVLTNGNYITANKKFVIAE